ncbi:MAG: magnesium/cobalt transporter CorA [Candidatus Aegiribacteria sp.]|nr:magnesium/cobalt transporter CorA [Candidatus Aegiribacteria sp.]MBD3294666.1 magnesium/cobalt transporter CorA [Candidatus Fermentibacteria bacterium]
MEEVRLSYMRYNENLYEEKESASVEECSALCSSDNVVWINVLGIHDPKVVEEIGEHFRIHPLTVEDIVNTSRRPKFEDFESYIFLVLRMLEYSSGEMSSEQVSLLLGSNYVITFQEKAGDVFSPVRDRIRNCKGRIRKFGADYLAYALMDAVVDSYFLMLESIGNRIEEVEDRVVLEPEPETVSEIHRFKRAMLYMRRTVWPLREEISQLEQSGSDLVRDSTQIFFRNLYDHTIQVIDTTETYRDTVSGMHDTYLSSVSNRMNEVMKVLTIIATIFIPLTFIAGVYGMNFRNMPELYWEYGYYITLGVMFLVAVAMVIYFKRKKWF